MKPADSSIGELEMKLRMIVMRIRSEAKDKVPKGVYTDEILALITDTVEHVIDVCRLEYIKNANTPLSNRLHTSDMAIHIGKEQRKRYQALLGQNGGDA